jgi:flagellar protein FliL
MANAATVATAPAPAEGVASRVTGGKQAGLIGALTFVGALLGGLLASLVVAPTIIARQAPVAAHADSAVAGVGAGEGKGSEGEGSEKKMVELSNIIVNPAGSQGTRFLMTSVAIAVADEEAQKLLTNHEVELRDRVTSILETQTMAQLTLPGARDSLKLKIAQAAGSIVGPGVPLKVFLPQFVIQ